MAKTLMRYTVAEAQNASLGQAGVVLIDDVTDLANAHVGPFVAITALVDAEVDVDQCDMSFIEDVEDFTIPKGVTIFGRFESISLDAGKVLAYRG
tara:strand:- start:3398 stop:3682 length:285 start_codon:yes stop_codon:yes gene_type:complete